MIRDVVARTPPAEYDPPDDDVTSEWKSVLTRLYPNVDEFAILSEMDASRVALA